MNYSINNSVPFSAINWNTLEGRPQVQNLGKETRFCEEKDWYADEKCCMDYYSIEHVRDVAYEYGNQNSPEVKFLDQYPCINGLEIDRIAYDIEALPSNKKPSEENSWPSLDCITKPILDGLKAILPKSLMDAMKPYSCEVLRG